MKKMHEYDELKKNSLINRRLIYMIVGLIPSRLKSKRLDRKPGRN